MFAVIVGILAGLLPGLFYTRVQIISAVKNLASIKLMNKLTMRKVLLVVQYTFSLTFITSVIIIYSQYEHFINYNLGFNTKAILNIKVQDANARTLEQALNEIPDIAQTSKSFMITSVGNNYYTHVKFNNPQDSIRAWYNKVDENYISLFDLKFLAGQNFTSHLETETEVIVNEELIRRLNIGSGIPVNAIGEFVQIEGKNLRIVGVLTNFHFSTLENAIGPFIFRNTGTSFNYINVKLSSNHFHEALQEIELMWKKTGSVHPFEAYFYDDLIQRAYSEYSAMVKVIGYLAVLTVIIASLGLIGMVVYSTDARLAEVSIRKVFGAQVKQLMFMLGSGFVTLLFLSAAIAIPITYFVFERMVLRNVTYHSPIGFFELAIGGFVMMLIALVLICSYTLKVANTNPADVLKNE
jgi:hypothetical protein